MPLTESQREPTGHDTKSRPWRKSTNRCRWWASSNRNLATPTSFRGDVTSGDMNRDNAAFASGDDTKKPSKTRLVGAGYGRECSKEYPRRDSKNQGEQQGKQQTQHSAVSLAVSSLQNDALAAELLQIWHSLDHNARDDLLAVARGLLAAGSIATPAVQDRPRNAP